MHRLLSAMLTGLLLTLAFASQASCGAPRERAVPEDIASLVSTEAPSGARETEPAGKRRFVLSDKPANWARTANPSRTPHTVRTYEHFQKFFIPEVQGRFNRRTAERVSCAFYRNISASPRSPPSL